MPLQVRIVARRRLLYALGIVETWDSCHVHCRRLWELLCAMMKQRKKSENSGSAPWVKPWPIATLERFETFDGELAGAGKSLASVAVSCFEGSGVEGRPSEGCRIVGGSRVLSRTRQQCISIARRFAAYLASIGVEDGDEVVVDLPPFVDVFSIWTAILYCGAIAVFLPIDRTRKDAVDALRRAYEKDKRAPVVVTTRGRVDECQTSMGDENVVPIRAVVYVDDLDDSDNSDNSDDAEMARDRGAAACAQEEQGVSTTSFERAIELCDPFSGNVHASAAIPIAIVYTQGTHANIRRVEIFNAIIDSQASEIVDGLKLTEDSSVFCDFPSIHTTTLATWAAAMLAGASFSIVRPTLGANRGIKNGYERIAKAMEWFKPTHAFLRPHILGAFMRDIRTPNVGRLRDKWRFLSLNIGKFKSRNTNKVLSWSYPLLRTAFTRPIKEKFFPGVEAIISYGNHFASKDAEVLEFLDLRSFNAYTVAEYGVVHLHEFKAQGSFLKSIESKVKNGNLFVRHKKVNSAFVDMQDLAFEDDRCGLCTRPNAIVELATGRVVDTSPVRDALKRHAIIDDAFIFGAGKPFLTALVYLNPDELEILALRLKLPSSSFDVLAQTPAVYEYVLNLVQSCNQTRASYEAVQKMAIVPSRIDEDPQILTLSKTPRMMSIQKRYAHILQSFYDDNF